MEKSYFYINGNLLLRDSLKMSIPLKRLDDNKILVYFYDDNNITRHRVITPNDTLNEEEYEKIMGHPKPQKSTASGKSGCYIATACYGNEFAPEVLHLKVFRDNILAKNYFGRLFIKSYYFLSPTIAEKLKGKERLNTFIRNQILNKIVKRIK